ncbi:MAG TPA: sigma-54 dependent transcriptional regulator [Burkholderiales bacterium]|jgi:DNA-binding NtrC family response regulator|nr:sigma-54 dependent transcriptional regulator [Burkholderiales bacterium]
MSNAPSSAFTGRPQRTKPGLLVVDDDPLITDTLDFVLGRDYSVHVAESRAQVKSLLQQLDNPPELALVDLGLPPNPHRPDEGFRLIRELLAYSPGMKVLVLSGQSDEANARYARTLGAIEFIAKPCEPAVLRELLAKALEFAAVERKGSGEDSGIIGSGPAIAKLHEQIIQYAPSPFPVLIEGESGSGKELVAASLHRRSPRAARPFLALNCAAISPTLVEPTLFGYSKGAFTGATSARAGYFEDAQEGTLFLDEIGELPLELQAKLLRVLENGEYQRVGETVSRVSHARVIAATNRDLRQEVKGGRFRADLYHRLSVFTIAVPPLRELGEDKLRLFEHFAQFYARQSGVAPIRLDEGARRAWMEYSFPGNVRELRNIVIRLTTKHAGRSIDADQLIGELDWEDPVAVAPTVAAQDFKVSLENARRFLQGRKGFNLDQALRELERSYVEAALEITQGNLSQAARLLGIHRTTLYSRMQAYEQAAQERQ